MAVLAPEKSISNPLAASATLILSASISPTLVILPSLASKLPAAIADEPTSIAPKPEVIEPESKAPVVTVSELPAKT